MNESNLINLIKKQIGDEYIGDDCAYLSDFGLVMTQDSLVENIHFKRDWITPYELGYKSIAVNISDIFASGAIPKYVTISLSLPKNIDENFVEKFYKGAKEALHGAKIVGGDITGSENDIFISVAAIGSDNGRKISSRKNAEQGYVIITEGFYGTSAAGLEELFAGGTNETYINAHLKPELNEKFSKEIAILSKEDYAMMDSSDGLADALFKIAQSSGVKICVDYDKIPHLDDIANPDLILFGGEDYNLVAAVPETLLDNLSEYTLIGRVEEKTDDTVLEIGNNKYSLYDELKVYNHFGEIRNGK